MSSSDRSRRPPARGSWRTPRLLRTLARLVPYPAGARVIRAVAPFRVVQGTLGRWQVRQFEQFLPLVSPGSERDRAVRRHLIAGGMRRWLYNLRLRWAHRCPRPALGGWAEVTGFEHLARARAPGRGVVLVNGHFGGGRLVPVVFAHMGVEILSLYAPGRKGGRPPAAGPDAAGLAGLREIVLDRRFPARATLELQRRLRQGGVVHLAADGNWRLGVALTFHGRLRYFAAGFADLAVSTGAPVLPVLAPFDEHGRLHIKVGEPLDSGPDAMPRAERVELLVRQYGRLLERAWAEDPGNVLPWTVASFLRLPIAPLSDAQVALSPAAHGS